MACGPSRKPPNSSFSRAFPLTSLAGDLSKVQWPAALQTLDLSGGYGKAMKIAGDLSKVQWPDGLQTLQFDSTNVSGASAAL